MANTFLTGLSSILLPLGLYGLPAQSSTGYQRSYLSASVHTAAINLSSTMTAAQVLRDASFVTTDELDIVSGSPVKELVVIDAAVPDKQVFYRAVKPGVDIVEIDSSQPGLVQLKAILKNYQGLKGLHIVSHAEEGVMLLGNSRVDSAALTNEKDTFASLNAALIHGADLVLYGCDLASGDNGGELLDIIRSNTHVDVAASNNKTGNAELGGDWDLEIQRGIIETELAFSEKALKDFSATLAPVIFQESSWTVTTPGFQNQRFTPYGSNNAGSVNIDAQVSQDGKTLTIDGEYNSIGVSPGYGIAFGFSEKSITLSFTDGSEFKPTSIEIFAYQGDPFTITTNNGGSLNGALPAYTDYQTHVIDLSSLPAGATSLTITNNSWAPFLVNTNSGFMGAIRKITFDSIGATNTTPTATNLTQSKTATEGGGAVPLNDIVVTDVDTGDTVTATLTLSDSSAGTLSTGTFGLVSSTFNAVTGVWTAEGSVANVNSALAAVTFTPSADNDQNFTIATRIRDTAGTGPADGLISFTVAPVNDAPTATNLTQSKTATEGGGAVALNGIVVTDVDTGDTITATFMLSDSSAGTLSTGTFGSATSTFNAGTGVWTVEGSVADVNAALAAVAFTPSANNEQDFTITTRIRDAAGIGPADGTISVTVTPVNDAPTGITLSASSISQSAALAGVEVGTFSSTDIDSNSFTYSLINAATAVAGTCAADSGNGSFQINGDVLETAAALAAGAYNLCIQTSDGAEGFKKGFTITVTDDIDPEISSVSVPADAWYIAGQTLSFTVNTTEDVTVTGLLTLPITIGLADLTASYAAGSGTTELTFSYTIQPGDNDSDGITLGGAINSSGGTLRDAAGNNTVLTLNAVGVTTGVRVDASAPTVQSLTPASGSATVDPDANFVMTFSENIKLGTTGSIVIYDALNNPVSTIDVTSHAGQLSIANNVLTVNPTADLIENSSYYIQITSGAITDMAGLAYSGIADSTSWNFTVADLLPPVVTSITVSGTPAANATSMDFTVVFDEPVKGQSPDDFVVTATSGNASGVIRVISGSGANYTVRVAEITGSGALRVDLKANTNITDNKGNGNGTNGYVAAFTGGDTHTVDRVAPAVPSAPDLASASDTGESNTDNITKAATPTLTGTADADTTLTVSSSVDGILGTQTADGAGSWSFTPSVALTDGTHSITVTASDAAGNVSDASAPLEITIDTTPPAKPLPPVLAAASDTGDSDSDNLTNLTTLTLQGAAGSVEADASVHLDGYLSSATANADGSWTLVVSNLTEGTHQLTIRATDIAGNQSVNSDPLAVTIDTTDPAPGTVTFDQSEVTAANETDIDVRLIGAEVGAKASFTITSSNGGTAVTSTDMVVVSPDHRFAGIDTSDLNDGTLTVSLTVTDLAGNVSSAITSTITKDANAPEISSIDIGSGNYAEGEKISVTITFSENVTVSGTGSTLALDIGGETRQATFHSMTATSMTYEYLVQTTDNTESAGVIVLANGLSLNGGTIRDAAGNDALLTFAQTANAAAQVDTIAPDSAVVISPAAPVSVNADDYSISGTHVENGLTVKLYLDANNDGVPDDSLVLDSAVVTNGSWSLNAPLANDSANNFVIVASDDAGNTSVSAVPTITDDSTAPNAPVALDLLAVSDTGISDSDNITRDTEPQLSGTAEPHSNITLTSNLDGVTGTAVADSLGGWTITSSVLSNGVHTLTATATDAAGNTSEQSTGLNVTVDDQAPTLSGVADQVLQPGTSISDLAITVSDVISDAANLTLSAESSDLAVVPAENLVLGGSGENRTITITALNSGTATITLTLEDEAGNTGTGTFRVAVNSAPTISGSPDSTVDQGERYEFIPTALDVDGDELTFGIVNKPSWANFDPATGTLFGRPSSAHVGVTQGIIIRVSDGELSASLASFDLEVINVNDAPRVKNPIPDQLASQGAAFSFQFDIETFTDIDVSDQLSFSVSLAGGLALPGWLSFTPSSRSFSGTPGNDDVGTLSITVTATDNQGLSVSDTFDITVVNANDAPTFSSLPATTAIQDQPYSYNVVASDIDVDDVIALRAETLPDWLSFDPVSGLLGGTPTNSDVGDHSVILRVTDVGGLYAEQFFIITVVNVNDAPTISGSPATTVNQDELYSFTPTASDVDVGDVLTFSATGLPSWLLIDSATGALTGTPTNANVGTTGSIVITVSDGTLTASLNAFTITVVNVNDAPVISGTPATTVSQDELYSFTPVASDVDAGDTLTFTATGLPNWLSINPATGVITGTPGSADVGETGSIVITVTDDAGEAASLPAFSITVVNVNDAPTITSSPITTATQGELYSYTLIAADEDAGDVLTLSAPTLPSWLNFNPATGVLSGTPTNENVGNHAVTLRAADVDGLSIEQSFSIAVANVNDAPTVTSTPITTATQGELYSYTLIAADEDAGDSTTLSAVTLPDWLDFNPATGVLSGTPTNADVGSHAVVLRATDAAGLYIEQSFTIVVADVNDAPVISGTPATTVSQDELYSFTPVASDVDAGDTLTFTATGLPSWLSINPATGVITGTPSSADVGETGSIVITVTDDAGEAASLPAFTITVANVNDAPIISGTPATTVNQDELYSFTPTASDVDEEDTLTFSITNKPDWAVFDETTGVLSGTPAHAHVGITTGIVISVSDGTLIASLPAFNLEVIETIDPLLPVVTAPADITLNATGLYTPVSLRQLLSLNPSVTQEQVEAILNSLASDGVSGNSCCTTHPEGLNDNDLLLLPPGRHEVVWSATNAADVSGTATQVVAINPLVSLSKSQIAIRGSTVEFRVLLNGNAPDYPFDVPYVLDLATTAASTEHNLVSGVVRFTAVGQLAVSVPVSITSLSGLTDSELVVSLDDTINTGAVNTHNISIREGNIAPAVTLQLMQAGVNTTQITPSGGLVTVAATVVDLNSGDTHSYDWSASDRLLGDIDGDPVNHTFVFEPSGLTGRHQVQLAVTDSGGASTSAQLYFRMVDSLPVLLPDADTDGDGIDDETEGFGDSNGNGIPNYLDNMPSSNVLPQQGAVTHAFLLECDPGLRCGVGQFALDSRSGGVQIFDEELASIDGLTVDQTFKPVGGIFDFVINDLPIPGQSARVVIPQQAPIPAEAVYRKYQNGTWVSFLENANNAIHSAPGNVGYCPPPGSPQWTLGLTEGHLCVQLTIEDGGPNDDDGLVNSAIADPGVVSVALPVEPPTPQPPTPEPPKPDIKLTSKGGGAVDGFWILLLGGLLMMQWLRTTRCKGLIALVLLGTSVSSQALTYDQAFVRVDVYKVEGGMRNAEFNQTLNAGYNFTLDNYRADRRGYQIAIGYQWHDYLYTELGYLDLGDVNVDMTLNGETDLPAFKQDLDNIYPRSGKGVTLVQGLTLFSEQPLNISLEAGAYLWRDDRRTNQTSIKLDDTEGVAPLAGIRLNIELTKTLSLGVNTRRIYLDNETVDLYSLSGRYRF